MKLFKRCMVEGTEYQIVSERIRLDIDRPGVAIIQLVADKALSGNVTFSMGWNTESALTLYFTGDVQHSAAVDGKQQKLLCREVSARIDQVAPVALRHPTMREVIARYADLTNLAFIVPEQAYADTKVPAFYGFGSAFHAMRNLGEVFHIADYIWLTQGDGRIYAGSWADSRWKGREVEIPQALFKRLSADGQGTLTVAPGLRPGCEVNGRRVETVIFSGHEMSIKCKNT